MSLINPVLAAALFSLAMVASAASDVQVDATKLVPSPDGKLLASVERLSTIRDTEPEPFSGRMIIRVTNASTKSTVKQRYVEASQVRQLEPPVWLNQDVCAFSYNIAKNAKGMVYFEVASGKAIQVELVSTARKMAASNQVEQELTSLDVTEHSTALTRIQNITHQGGTVFPLQIKRLPLDKPPPYGLDFFEELKRQLKEYHEFCRSHGVKQIVPEQATESVSEDNSHLAVLACADTKSAICLVPISDAGTTTVTLNILEGVRLPCAETIAENTEVALPEADAAAQDYRHATSWKPDGTAIVEREVFDANGENSRRVPVFIIKPGGVLQKASPAEKQPKP